MLTYIDGERRYILAPDGLKVGDQVVSGPDADIKLGNALPLENIPLGTVIHNIELKPGKGGQLVRAAGNLAQLMAKEGGYAQIRLPSGEVRKVSIRCKAAIGQWEMSSMRIFQSAGRQKALDGLQTNRSQCRHDPATILGGGEGKSPSVYNPVAQGSRHSVTRPRKKNKQSDKLIVKDATQVVCWKEVCTVGRSLKKGPFVDEGLSRIDDMNDKNENRVINLVPCIHYLSTDGRSLVVMMAASMYRYI